MSWRVAIHCGRKCLFEIFLWAIFLISVVTQYHYFAKLPPRVAVHFNALGQADAWASKQEYFLTNLFLLLGMTVLFQLMIISLDKRPAQLLNIPNKSFWLSPERRNETLNYIRRYLLWMATLTMLFLAGLSYQITLVNYYHTLHLGSVFWLMFGVYLVAIILLTTALIIHFIKLPAKKNDL